MDGPAGHGTQTGNEGASVMPQSTAVKRVTAFVGTARKKHTYSAVREFLDRLEAHGGVECEIVTLNDFRIDTLLPLQARLEPKSSTCRSQ